MADPISATIAVVAATLGGIQAFATTRSRNHELEANARAAEMNASIANQNAALEARRRERELTENRRKYNLLKGQTRAQSGALGIFGGSTLDVLADMDTQQIFEQRAIVDERTSAQQSNYNQAAAFKNQARGMLAGRQSPWFAAATELVSGMGSAAQIAGI